MKGWIPVAALTAAALAVIGLAVVEARAADGGVTWECGGFEVPLHTWNKGRETWMSPSDNGLVLEAGAGGATLPPGWTPIGGGAGPIVVACRPVGTEN